MKSTAYSIKRIQFAFLLLLIGLTNQQVHAQCGAALAYAPTVNATTVCSGSQVYLYANGLPVVNWIYRNNNTGNWISFASNSQTTNQFVNVSVPTIRTYKAVLSTVNCLNDTTSGVDVNFILPTYGNNASILLSASSLSVCSGNLITLRMMNQGIQPYVWLYRDNGGAWNPYSYTTAQSISLNMPSTSTSLVRDFRVLVKNPNSCQQDSSALISITVNPSIAGNNPNSKPTSTQTSICSGSSVTLQTDWPLLVGNWIYRDSINGQWQTFNANSANVNDFNTNVNRSVLREYKVILIDPNTCKSDTSARHTVAINTSTKRVLSSILPRFTSTSFTQVCAGNSVSMQLNGYSNLTWIYKDSSNGNWIVFSSGTNTSLSSNSNITKDLNREIRVVVNNAANTCSIDTSAAIFYTVKANIRGNSTTAIPFTASSELCIGTQVSVYLQNGQSINGWLTRNNNAGVWQNSFSSSNTFIENVSSSYILNTLRSYRALVNNTAQCQIDTTPEVQILFKLPTVGNTVAITPTVNQPAYCASSTVQGSISIGNTRTVNKWLYRDNNAGLWTEIPFSNSTFFSQTVTGIVTSTIRSYRALLVNLETYKIDSSAEVAVVINPVSRGNLSLLPTTPFSTICNDNSVQVSVVFPTGYAMNNWIYRDTMNQTWTNGGSSNPLSNFISTTRPTRIFRAILLNQGLCKFDTTGELVIIVNKKVTRNNLAYQPTVTTPTVCSGTSLNISLTTLPSGSTILRWIYRDNTSDWKTINSTSTNYFEQGNNTRVLASTIREYKAIINDNNNCFTDTSAGVLVTINPNLNGVISGITPTTNLTINCGGTGMNLNISYNGVVQKWQYKDNGGSWSEFATNTESTSLFDNNTFVNAITNRGYRAILVRANSCLIDTTQILNTQIKPYIYGSAAAIQPSSTQPNVCSGSSFNVNILSGSGYSVHKWIFKENNTGEWKELDNSSSTPNLFESNINVVNTTIRSYRAIILTNTCSYDTTSALSIQLNPRSYGYASATTITSSVGVYCSASPINLNIISATMPAGATVRNWLYMDNMSGNWIGIQNSTSTVLNHSNTFVSIPTSRAYRAIINNGNTCSYDSSNIFSVSINTSTQGYASTITPTISTTNVCNANTNPVLNISLPSGYTIQKWVVNNNGTGWTDFGYTTNSTSIIDYNTAVITPTSRNYRAILNNGNSCSIDSSNIVSATINPPVLGVLSSLIPTSSRTNYCYTKQINVSISTPSGYSVDRWIVSNNGSGWNEFSTSNATTIIDNNTYVPITSSRSYRVILLNNVTCQRDTSAALTVIISPRSTSLGLRSILPTTNPISGICSGSSVSLNVNPGSGNELIKWTYSDNGNAGPWNDVLNSYNSSSFSHSATQTNIAYTRLYRAIITDTSTCDLDSTQSVALNILPITYGTDTSITISGLDSVCVGTAVTLNIVLGSGNSVNKWIYRDNSGPWLNFESSTSSNFLTDNKTQVIPGTTRGYTPLVFKTSVCRIDTLSKVKNVFFKTKTYGTGTTIVNVTADTVCAGNSLNVSTSGVVEKWFYRDGSTGPWLVIENTSTFLTHSATGVTSSNWRFYRALLNSGACNADTTRADSVFLKIIGNGNTAITATTSNTTVCAGNGVNLNLSISGANIQRWLYKDNNLGDWIILSTSNSTSITDFNTAVSVPVTRAYRVIFFRNCSYDTTDALIVNITPKTRGIDLTKTPTATSNIICTGSSVQNIQVNAGSGNSIVEWLYRNNNGVWVQFAAGNQNNLNDYNTFTGVPITRDYIAIINNNTTCKIDTSAKLAVTINPIVLGNSPRTVTGSLLACMGGSYLVSMNVLPDSNIIRFLYNTNGGAWVDRGYISPSTSASFTEFAYNSSTAYTMGHRALIYKASTCRIDTTAPLIVTVNPRVNGNDNSITASGASTACSGTSFTVSISPGSGNTISKWLFNDNGGVWNSIFTASQSFSNSATTSSILTRRYRALILKGNTCTIDTSAALLMTINPIVYGTDSVAQVSITSAKPGCTGNAVNISVNPGSGNSVNTWLFRNGSGSWNNMFLSSNTISDFNTLVSAPIARVYGTVIWKLATCKMDTTRRTDTINITPRLNRYDSTITVTSTLGSACVGTPVPLTVSVGANTIDRWIYRDNGGIWNTLSTSSSTSISDFNTSVSAITSREYRVVVRKATVCAIDTSMPVIVTLSPRSISTDATIIPTVNNSTVCSGSSLTISVNPGTGNTIQKWIYRINSGAWQDFSFTSSSTVSDFNTTVSSSVTRTYRAIILKGSGCSIDSSASVSATINPIGFGNQNSVSPLANNSAVCSGSPVTLSISGFVGSSVLRWLYRNASTDAWTVVNSTSTVYSDFNTTTSVALLRQYRAIINNNTGCSTDSSGITTVSINPITNGTIALATQASQPSVCAGVPVNLFLNTPSGRTIVGWLYRDTANWLPMNVGVSASVNDFATGVTINMVRSYRAILSNAAGCSLDSTNAVSVSINLITQGTNLTITPTTTTPTLCSGTNAVVSVSGFSGTIVRWLYRDTVTDSWSVINSTNFTLFHTNTFVLYPRVRQYRAVVNNPSTCSNDSTAAVQVQVNPLLQGNANAISPVLNNTAVCTGTNISMSATGFINGGTVVGWVFSDNGAAPIRITGASSNTFVHTATNVTVLTNRIYRALVLTGCSTDTTAGSPITIDVFPVKPVVSATANTDSLVSSVIGTTYQWKLNGTIIGGATNRVHIATQTGNYSVEVGNSTGCKTASDAYNHLKVGLEDDLLDAGHFTIYPNPTHTGLALLTLHNMVSTTIQVAITDMLGKQILTTALNTDLVNELQLDLSNEQAGIYFITLSSGTNSKTYKLVNSK